MNKNWVERPRLAAPVSGLAEALNLSPQFLDLLLRRGFGSAEEINDFLNAPLAALTPPERWPQIPEAAEDLARIVQTGKKIAVWGDYDADGVTATALSREVLAAHHANLVWYLPDRLTEGYGLNVAGVESLAENGCEALLTVDCGISNHEAVGRARELGMEVILTDHHMPPPTLPNATRIVDPRIPADKPWPCENLAGVGVAFYLLAQVNRLLAGGRRIFKMDQVLDLTALGTLSDVMLLEGENRLLVRAGLRRMGARPRTGIAALKLVAGLGMSAELNSDQVVFALTPRINAAGRMDNAGTALDLLTTDNELEAAQLARLLDELNEQRKKEGNRILDEARIQADELLDQRDYAGLVLYGQDWHPGIVGIVATRIAEEYNRPAIVMCGSGEMIKGSGRTLGDFDLHAGLERCSRILAGFGGHKMAAGMRLELKDLDLFRKAFSDAVNAFTGGRPLRQTLWIDGALDFAHARQHSFLQEIALMQPFGAGNPEPVFASPRLEIIDIAPLGRRGESVCLDLKDLSTGITLRAKAWRRAREFPLKMIGETIQIAYTPRLDYYRNIPSIDLQIADWRKKHLD